MSTRCFAAVARPNPVIDGNPIDDIDVGAKPDKSLKVTMKDGKLYKTTLPA